MTKNFSIISMLAMIFFITTSFTTSKLQSTITETDKFGFPFAFFQPAANGAAIGQANFSLLGILGDLTLWFGLAFILVFTFSTFFRFEKAKPVLTK